MYVFLGLNGYRLIAEEPEVVIVLLDVASRKDAHPKGEFHR